LTSHPLFCAGGASGASLHPGPQAAGRSSRAAQEIGPVSVEAPWSALSRRAAASLKPPTRVVDAGHRVRVGPPAGEVEEGPGRFACCVPVGHGPGGLQSSCNTDHVRAPKASPKSGLLELPPKAKRFPQQHHLHLLPAEQIGPRPVARAGSLKGFTPKGPGQRPWPRKRAEWASTRAVLFAACQAAPLEAPGPLSAGSWRPVPWARGRRGGPPRRFHVSPAIRAPRASTPGADCRGHPFPQAVADGWG